MHKFVYIIDLTAGTGQIMAPLIFINRNHAIDYIKQNYPAPTDQYAILPNHGAIADGIYISRHAADGTWQLVRTQNHGEIVYAVDYRKNDPLIAVELHQLPIEDAQ